MELAIEPGWAIQFDIDEMSGGRAIEYEPGFTNVERVEVISSNLPEDWSAGESYLVQVVDLCGEYARVQPYYPARSDTLLPGYSVELSMTEFSTDGIAKAAVDSWPHIEEVDLYGGAPATPLSVTIDAVAPMDGVAIADVRQYRWPADGSEISVQIEQGQSVAVSANRPYEFPLQERAPTSGRATATVHYVDEQLCGEITEYHDEKPAVGDVVRAELNFEKHPGVAWLSSTGDRIELQENVAVGGRADIRITQAEHPLQGCIEALPEAVPSVGDKVEAYARRNANEEAYARPASFEGVIRLPDGVEGTGFVRVLITEAGSVLEGEVTEYLGAPAEGDIVVAEVDRGKPPVTGVSLVGERDIRLNERVLASGEVRVELTDSGPPLRGEIVSYEGLLPDVGDVVTAQLSQSGSTAIAEPVHGTCRILVSDADGYTGLGEIEITEVGKVVKGSLVAEVDSGQHRSSEGSKSPFKPQSEHPNLVNKKH